VKMFQKYTVQEMPHGGLGYQPAIRQGGVDDEGYVRLLSTLMASKSSTIASGCPKSEESCASITQKDREGEVVSRPVRTQKNFIGDLKTERRRPGCAAAEGLWEGKNQHAGSKK